MKRNPNGNNYKQHLYPYTKIEGNNRGKNGAPEQRNGEPFHTGLNGPILDVVLNVVSQKFIGQKPCIQPIGTTYKTVGR